LRAAGVSFKDRQDLLGHRSGRITTHCSAAELTRPFTQLTVCDRGEGMPELVVLRRLSGSQLPQNSRKVVLALGHEQGK
jgi:hypothetical protein